MEILTHSQIWSAIDALADRHNISTSGLARKSGLDPTSFNPSKRLTQERRERWPSTESIAKILKATETSVADFMVLVEKQNGGEPDEYTQITKTLPLIGLAQAGTGGFFDDGGFPVGQGWEQITPPTSISDTAYALEVSGDSMLPLYRAGDIIIVDPAAKIHKGDRVVAKTIEGEVFAKILEKNSSSGIILKSVNQDYGTQSFAPNELEWIARILWASQ